MARLPHFESEMRRKHMTLQLLWEEYKKEKPDGYGITQFRFHYRQNAVAAQAVPTTVLKCWQTLVETRQCQELSLIDGLQLLLQSEEDHRRNSRQERLIKEARFRYRATLPETKFEAARGFDRSSILALATGSYISKGDAVIITGSTGTGESWLATALGYQACLDGRSVRYLVWRSSSSGYQVFNTQS